MQKHKKWSKVKKQCFAGWLSLVSGVLFLNARLDVTSHLVADIRQAPSTLLLQLNANRTALESNAASQVQQFSPEVYNFSYLLHRLTWVELARQDPQYSAEAIEQAGN